MRAYVAACGADAGTWEPRWRAAADAVSPPEPAARPPYLGLATFEGADREVFFGRDRLVARVVERLGSSRFVAVVGASGSGKSSLLRAGVAPALPAEAGTLVLTPGRTPMTEWSARLAAFLAEPRSGGHVVIVDQFEELFTMCDDEAEQSAFVALLVAVASRSEPAGRVVVGVRADFYARCLQLPALVAWLEAGHVTVGPVSVDELREIVVRPAERAGCTVDDALLARVLGEAAGQLAALPLVSHALLETWRRRQGTVLTVEAYEATGGVREAITRTAESAFVALDRAEQRVARELFLRLVAIGEDGETGDTRRRVGRDELDIDGLDASSGPDGDRSEGAVLPVVLDKLAAARLVTIGADTVELVHETLIRAWPRLRGWCAEDRAGLQIHRRLTLAAQTWQSLGREPAALAGGASAGRARGRAAQDGARSVGALERRRLPAGAHADEPQRAAADLAGPAHLVRVREAEVVMLIWHVERDAT